MAQVLKDNACVCNLYPWIIPRYIVFTPILTILIVYVAIKSGVQWRLKSF
jgi:hypothetical protein